MTRATIGITIIVCTSLVHLRAVWRRSNPRTIVDRVEVRVSGVALLNPVGSGGGRPNLLVEAALAGDALMCCEFVNSVKWRQYMGARARAKIKAINSGSDIIAMAAGWLSPTGLALLICPPGVTQVSTGGTTFRLPP